MIKIQDREACRCEQNLHEDKHVHGIVVFAKRSGDKPIVVRIDDGRVQDTVYLKCDEVMNWEQNERRTFLR